MAWGRTQVMNRNTVRRAWQSAKGMHNIANRRIPRSLITRVPMIEGTLQPKPITCSTKARPSSPSQRMKPSIRNAALGKYPESSMMANKT